MRAARAAASRGEDGDITALGGSPKYLYTKSRPRASSFDHQSSRSMKSPPHQSSTRSRLLLPPNRHTSVSQRHPTPTTKQKRVPKGSATKRSRVVVRVAAARGQVRHQHGVDSRFPMPYPEVDRDRRQPRALPVASERQDHQYHYNYNSGEKGALKRAGAGYPESRRMVCIDRSHGPIAASSRRRTRPRSAMVAPFSRAGSGSGNADRSSQRAVVSQLKRKQGISNASTAGERNQRGGSKRPRPASAPSARGAHDRCEKPGGNKGEGGVLIALSRMAGGSSCAPAELRIMKWVVLRETYLTKLRGVVSANRKRAKSAATIRNGRPLNAESDHRRRSPQKLFSLLTELLTVLRRITVEIVEAVEKWRGHDKGRPFIWGSSNYLVKAAGDIEFLSRLPGLEEYLGVVVLGNPFLSHTGLDGCCTILNRSSIRSRSGKFPLSASGSLGVSTERVAAAAAVLYREVRRVGLRREGGGRRGEEGLRPCSDEPPRVVRSPTSGKNRLVSPPGRYRLAGPGPDKRSGVRDRIPSGRQGERQRRPVRRSDAAAAGNESCGSPPRHGRDRNLHDRDRAGYQEKHHREDNKLMCKERKQEERQNIHHLDGGGRRAGQPAHRRRSSGPELTEVGEISRHPEGARRSPSYIEAAENNRQVSEERRTGDETLRRKYSSGPKLTEAEMDSRHAQQGPRRSLSYNNEAPEDTSHRRPLSLEAGEDGQDGGVAYDDNRPSAEEWHDRNNSKNPADGGRRRVSQLDIRRSSRHHGDSRHADGGRRRRSTQNYYADVERGDDDSGALPPDDQSLDYQNGGGAHRDDYYYYQQQDEGDSHRDGDQNLDYYYEEGGYGTYAEDEHEQGYDARDAPAENHGRSYIDRDPVDAESRPDYSLRPLPGATPEHGAAGESDDPVELPPDSTADELHRQEWRSDVKAPVVVGQTTEALPAATEETKSSDDRDPQDESHGRMGRRGSPFNLIFNMCDGMLTDLKGLEDRSYGGEDGGVYEFEPTTFGNTADVNDGSGYIPSTVTVGREGDQKKGEGGGDDCISPAKASMKQNAAVPKEINGEGGVETPPPALRGAVYASLTRKIVAMGVEGGTKPKKGSSGDEGGSDTENPNRIMADSFSAWAERTEVRLRHRDAKAAKHYRLGQLRYAMSAWEVHRASFLGRRMAEAFAGSFGLSSRFFVRFTFDALRAHARGSRLAARNRAALETFVSRVERFGKARLRQAWRRWALPRIGPEYWEAGHEEALRKICWYWGRGRLRGALSTWRRQQPESNSEPARTTLHASGSFAVLKGKLKTVGSFVNPNASKPPRSVVPPTPSKASRQHEKSTTTNKARFEDEDGWAEWLDNEASISVVAPDGERTSLPAAAAPGREVPSASSTTKNSSTNTKVGDGNNVAARGTPLLPSSRSFHGLGVAIKSIKSFRDGRDKSQTQRARLRPTASFGSPPESSSSSPAPPLDPAATDATMKVIDTLQMNHFAANRTKIRGEAAKLRSREEAAATIQRALWTTPREREVALRVSHSASLIQRLWRLRRRRSRAGLLLVRAWRKRPLARAATLDRALFEAASEGDLRAVAFLLSPAAAVGLGLGSGLAIGVDVGGADTNAAVGTERQTALHAAAAAGGGGGRGRDVGGRHHHQQPPTTAIENGVKDAAADGSVLATPTVASCSTLTNNPDGLVDVVDGQRGAGGNWLRGKGGSANWVGVIQALVEAGATIEARDGRGFTPMMTAAEEGSRETVAALATLGAEVHAKELRGGRRTPLVLAAQKANVPAAAALLEYGARANFTVGDSLTPLHEAVGAGSIAVAEMLVRAGANVNATNDSAGMTPLHLAVANDQHAAARLLVHSGANVCLPDARGLTCLRLTVEMADAPTVALLLAAEPPADLSVQDENGGTVLHATCRLGLTDIAQLLLEHGADPHVRDGHGKTPELVALDLGHADCAGLFYNVDIHSYAPKHSSGADDDSSAEDDGSGRGRGGGPNKNNVHRGGRSSTGSRSGDDDDGDEGEGEGEGDDDAREGAVGDVDERASGSKTLRDGFAEAVAAARRASSLSMEPGEQAEQPQQRSSGSSPTWGGGIVEAGQTWTNSAGNELVEGDSEAWRREGQAELLTSEGYGGEENDTGNVDADEGEADWEWSETEGWVRGRDSGENDPVEDQARPLEVIGEENKDSTETAAAAATTTITTKTDYNNEGYQDETGYYKEARSSYSYSGWEGSPLLGAVEGQQQEGEEIASKHPDANDDNGGSGGGSGHEQGRNVGAAANHDISSNGANDDDDGKGPEYPTAATTLENNTVDGSNARNTQQAGWASAVAATKATTLWLSKLDTLSGSFYYQNERTGSTQWDLPEGGAVVVDDETAEG